MPQQNMRSEHTSEQSLIKDEVALAGDHWQHTESPGEKRTMYFPIGGDGGPNQPDADDSHHQIHNYQDAAASAAWESTDSSHAPYDWSAADLQSQPDIGLSIGGYHSPSVGNVADPQSYSYHASSVGSVEDPSQVSLTY